MLPAAVTSVSTGAHYIGAAAVGNKVVVVHDVKRVYLYAPVPRRVFASRGPRARRRRQGMIA